MAEILLILVGKNTADQDSRHKNLALSSNHKTYNIRRLKLLLLLQVSSYDYEPTFIICFVIRRVLPDQPK